MVAREEYLNPPGIENPEGKSFKYRSGDNVKTIFQKQGMKYELGAKDSWQLNDVSNKDMKRLDHLSNPTVLEEFSCRWR